MPKGLPASYIKRAKRELGKGASFSRIFKRAWELYKGSKVYKAVKGNPRSKKSKTKKGGSRKVAKKKSRRIRSFTIPLAPVIGISAGLFTPAKGHSSGPINQLMAGNWEDAFRQLAKNYTGVDISTGKWDFEALQRGLLPLIIGIATHKLASYLGVNRALGRARVPLIRI